MRDRAMKKFYDSKEWKDFEKAYLTANPYCVRCANRGVNKKSEVAHHKLMMTDKRMQDEELAFGSDNLQALCYFCHVEVHHKSRNGKRFKIDENGKIVILY